MLNWRIQVSNQSHVRKDHVPLWLTIQSAFDCDWRSNVQGAKDPNAYTSQKLVSEATHHFASFKVLFLAGCYCRHFKDSVLRYTGSETLFPNLLSLKFETVIYPNWLIYSVSSYDRILSRESSTALMYTASVICVRLNYYVVKFGCTTKALMTQKPTIRKHNCYATAYVVDDCVIASPFSMMSGNETMSCLQNTAGISSALHANRLPRKLHVQFKEGCMLCELMLYDREISL